MDRLQDMASSAGGIGDMLKGVEFPIQKDQLISKLSEQGAPSRITDKLRGADTDRFKNQADVMSKVKGLF